MVLLMPAVSAPCREYLLPFLREVQNKGATVSQQVQEVTKVAHVGVSFCHSQLCIFRGVYLNKGSTLSQHV